MVQCVTVCLPVRPSICPFVRLTQRRPTTANPVLQICCCGPGWQKIPIDCSAASCGERLRAVPRCQRTQVAEHIGLHVNCWTALRVGGTRASGRSCAAGCTAANDSVAPTSYIDTSARTPATEGSNVSTAAGDLLAPTISRNTRARTCRRRRHLANAAIRN